MKNLIYLTLFLIVGIAQAQVISFADNDFKLKLLESDVTNNIAKSLGGNNLKIDADNDSQITVQEAALVYELFLPNESAINSLEGILFFVNLTKLDAQSSAILGSVNLSNMPLLEYIFLNNNQINELNVSGCISMIEIDCNNNLLQKVDVSTLIKLEDLKVANNPILQIFAKNGTDETIDFSGTLNQNINYICADEIQILNLQAQVTNGCIVNSYCTSVLGGNFNTIKGKLYFDAEGNGLDSSDLPWAYVKLKSTLGNDDSEIVQTVTEQDANYTFTTTETGDFDVVPSIENSTWFTITNVAGNFPDSSNNVFNQNFILAPVGIHTDVEVMVRPTSEVISGSNASYEIVFKNKGNQTHTGEVTFGFNENVLDFVSSTIPLVNSGTGVLSLAYTNLRTFETRSFQVVLNVNSAVKNGDVLDYSLSITPNGEELSTQSDNFFLYRQNVQATNPNRIECIQGSSASSSEIGKFLHYAINFENTGTQIAKNVVVNTNFDATQYDINSIQILNSSSELLVSAQNQKVRLNMRRANVGGPGGQGGILLKIKTNNNLTNGSTVNTEAEIFFDYDAVQTAPIVSQTEIANTTFQNLSLLISDFDQSINVSPNPTTSIINVVSNNVLQTIQLYDIYGRLLQTNVLNGSLSSIDLTSRSSGVYFLKITSDKGHKIEKVFKK